MKTPLQLVTELQNKQDEIDRLQTLLESSADNRREWMDKAAEARQQVAELKQLCVRAADAIDRPETRIWRYEWVENLIAELRKAAQ